MADVIQANDLSIPRDRAFRTIVFFATPVTLMFFGALLTGWLASTFLGDDGPFFSLGAVVGLIGGFVGFMSIKHMFVVQNDTTGVLVTTDRLRSLLGWDNVNVIYGPGTHFSFPWEERFAKNNIPAIESAEEFTFPVMCKDGTLTVSASVRMRPDFENPVNYLSGVGAVAGDMKDLVIAFITGRLTGLQMQGALDQKAQINLELKSEFVGARDVKTPFELRFGVQVGDVTMSNMLMSAEAQRTRTALNEAAVVSQGTAILLGFTTVEEMQQALGVSIQQADIDRARREFRIISGNMDGAEVKRFEVDVTGLTPQIAEALTAFLNNPAARSFFSSGPAKKPAATKKGTTP